MNTSEESAQASMGTYTRQQLADAISDAYEDFKAIPSWLDKAVVLELTEKLHVKQQRTKQPVVSVYRHLAFGDAFLSARIEDNALFLEGGYIIRDTHEGAFLHGDILYSHAIKGFALFC